MKQKRVNNRSIVYSPGTSFVLMPEGKLVSSLHCHAAYELIVIEEGTGKEYIAEAVRDYLPGDIVFLGKNLPHLYLPLDKEQNRSRILQFPETLFPCNMRDVPEMSRIADLLSRSEKGLLFRDEKIHGELLFFLDKIQRLKSLHRLTALYEMLDYLGGESGFSLLSVQQYRNPLESYSPNDPISVIRSYLINHHKEALRLTDLAKLVNLNETSMCRLFKQRTGKTIFGYLAELRVECACKLLSTTDMNVMEIASECGFGNQAHFNKQFLRITGHKPTEYRHHSNTKS